MCFSANAYTCFVDLEKAHNWECWATNLNREIPGVRPCDQNTLEKVGEASPADYICQRTSWREHTVDLAWSSLGVEPAKLSKISQNLGISTPWAATPATIPRGKAGMKMYEYVSGITSPFPEPMFLWCSGVKFLVALSKLSIPGHFYSSRASTTHFLTNLGIFARRWPILRVTSCLKMC